MRCFSPKLLLSLIALMLSLSVQASKDSAPKVLVSIKPLQLIAAVITEGVSQPELLLQPGSSPHDYSMKPSDVKKIAKADFIFWVGEDLERFLEKPLDRFAKTFSILAVMEAPGVKVRKFSEDDSHSDVNNKAEGHDDHDHGDHDPHVWLDPDNALAIAKAMEKSLSSGDKDHAATYQANYQRFQKQIASTDQRIKQILQPISDKGFFVFHDAWGYFTTHYNLKVAGIFTVSPEQQPGARHIAEIRQKLKAAGNTCIFREPQFKPAYLSSVTKGLKVQVKELDPLGTNTKVEPGAYQDFLGNVAQTIVNCMTDS